jgi:16S rRNA (uracil1498-N3)-methyltransferase
MSRPPRFFIAPSQVSGSRISVTDEDVRHIAAVLRMKIGDALLLCDGQGTEYQAAIAELSKSEIKADIVSQSSRASTGPRITLGQGLPKSDKMDWIVQKATELGVSDIVPLVTERTIVKIRDEEKRISRWQKIAREAAMQSDRLDIPQIGTVVGFKVFLRALNPEPGTLLLLPWEESSAPIKDVLTQHAGAAQIIVLIGPEGGFSSAEASMAREKGFHALSLGPNILRTETAAIAVLSMLTYEYCS